MRTRIAWTLAALYGASITLSYAQSYIMATVTQNVCGRLRSAVSKKINRLPLRYFDTTSTGDILSRVVNDVDTIGQTLNQSVSGLAPSLRQTLADVRAMSPVLTEDRPLEGELRALIATIQQASWPLYENRQPQAASAPAALCGEPA